MNKSINVSVFVFLVSVLMSGCASYEQNRLERLSAYPDVSMYENKPSVYVDLNLYIGEPGKRPTRVQNMHDDFVAIFEGAIEDSGLFREYTFDASDMDEVDYTLALDVYNHGNQGLAFITGFITGYSFGVIPSAATDNYTLVLKALDKNGNNLAEEQNDDAIRTWMGIWFLPVSSNTPQKAVTKTLENQLKVALNELIKSNALKYSAIKVESFSPSNDESKLSRPFHVQVSAVKR